MLCLQNTTGRSSPRGTFYPRVMVTAHEVENYGVATIRGVTENNLSAEITINVASDNHLDVWRKLQEISDAKELERFILNRRMNMLPPFLQESLLWKIKDYHPFGWFFNVTTIMAGHHSWASLIKELGITATGKPAIQMLDHLVGAIFGDDWHDRIIASFSGRGFTLQSNG